MKTFDDVLNSPCPHGPEKIPARDCQTCQRDMVYGAYRQGLMDAMGEANDPEHDYCACATYIKDLLDKSIGEQHGGSDNG